MAEAQAVDRVHRIGQTRQVECVKDCIEEVSRPTVDLTVFDDTHSNKNHLSVCPMGSNGQTQADRRVPAIFRAEQCGESIGGRTLGRAAMGGKCLAANELLEFVSLHILQKLMEFFKS